MTAPSVLVLAGLDPSGGAGLLADAEAIRAIGARPLCVATALTVQTTRAVRRWEPVSAKLVAESAAALLAEEDVRAIKIGMIGDPRIAESIARLLPRVPVVVDPVLQASSGALLFKGTLDEAREAYLSLARGALITPNVPELAALLGLATPPADAEGLTAAARALLAKGPQSVLAKGGHLPGTPVDVLATAEGVERFGDLRIPGTRRGTGCRLASAIAAALALGAPLSAAVARARQLVRDYLGTP